MDLTLVPRGQHACVHDHVRDRHGEAESAYADLRRAVRLLLAARRRYDSPFRFWTKKC
jgi:hypothetical protein